MRLDRDAALAFVHCERSRSSATGGRSGEGPITSYGVVVDRALKIQYIVAAVGLNIHLQSARGLASKRAGKSETSSSSRAAREAGTRSREIQVGNVKVSTARLAHAQAEIKDWIAVIRTHQCCCPVSVDRAVM